MTEIFMAILPGRHKASRSQSPSDLQKPKGAV